MRLPKVCGIVKLATAWQNGCVCVCVFMLVSMDMILAYNAVVSAPADMIILYNM